VSFVVVTVLFAMMFKWLPDASVAWRDALLTALFFEVGKVAIGFYIGKQGLESTYGAAASIVVQKRLRHVWSHEFAGRSECRRDQERNQEKEPEGQNGRERQHVIAGKMPKPALL